MDENTVFWRPTSRASRRHRGVSAREQEIPQQLRRGLPPGGGVRDARHRDRAGSDQSLLPGVDLGVEPSRVLAPSRERSPGWAKTTSSTVLNSPHSMTAIPTCRVTYWPFAITKSWSRLNVSTPAERRSTSGSHVISAPVSTRTRRKLFHRGRRPGLVTRTSTLNMPIPSPLYGHSPQTPRRPYRIGVLDEAWAANHPTVEGLKTRAVIVWPEELAPNQRRFPTSPWSQRP